MTAVGRLLRQTVTAYNSMVGSVEARLLPSARRMHEHGVGFHELEAVAPVEVTPRELSSGTAVSTGEEEQEQDNDDEVILHWADFLAASQASSGSSGSFVEPPTRTELEEQGPQADPGEESA